MTPVGGKDVREFSSLFLMKKREIPEIDGVAYTVESVLGEGGAAEASHFRFEERQIV